MRLIDLDDAIKKAGESDKVVGSDIWETSEVVEFLEGLPTIEAASVVHGRWEEVLVPDGYVQKASRVRKKCSACDWTNACRYKFCPNCGAKMDGGG